jgi:hypothetical protein
MSDTARDYQPPMPASTEGLDDLFLQGVLEKREESSDTEQGVLPEVAAAQLGLSVSGVLKRLRRGNLPGFKVQAIRGEKWLVCPTALPEGVLETNKESSVSTEGVLDLAEESSKESLDQAEESSVNTEGVLDLAEESLLLSDEMAWEIQGSIVNSEAAPVQSNTGNVDVAELLRKLEGATYRIGYLESKLEDREKEIKLLTDSQHKAAWWKRFYTWFIGR